MQILFVTISPPISGTASFDCPFTQAQVQVRLPTLVVYANLLTLPSLSLTISAWEEEEEEGEGSNDNGPLWTVLLIHT